MKREAAFGILLFWGGLYIWGILGNPEALTAAQALTHEVLGVVTLAFGSDFYAKQVRDV